MKSNGEELNLDVEGTKETEGKVMTDGGQQVEFAEQVEIRESEKSPEEVRAFFESIEDVTNLQSFETNHDSLEIVHDGEVVGMRVFEELPTKVFLHRTAIKPEYRRRGLASKSLEELIERYDHFGRFVARVRSDNSEVQAHAETFGFDKVDERPLEVAGKGIGSLLTYELTTGGGQ